MVVNLDHYVNNMGRILPGFSNFLRYTPLNLIVYRNLLTCFFLSLGRCGMCDQKSLKSFLL